jgi:hypothetical protein
VSAERKLSLSKSEVNSVIGYIWQHSRGSPDGAPFKVWKKMFDFLNDDQQELDFHPKKQILESAKNTKDQTHDFQ